MKNLNLNLNHLNNKVMSTHAVWADTCNSERSNGTAKALLARKVYNEAVKALSLAYTGIRS